MTIIDPTVTVHDHIKQLNTAHAQVVAELQEEIRILKLQLEGNIPDATFWLYRKVYRQKDALDKLNRRVVSQRFVLRTLEELGRGLTREEYISARDSQPENLKDRIQEAT